MLSNFEYCVPTKAVFGKGTIDQVGGLIPKSSRVFLLYGGGSIKRNGIYDRILKQVTPAAEFGGIEANPDNETCVKAIELGRKEKIDFILAVGGGSVVDAAKYIACGISWDKSSNTWDLIEKWGLAHLSKEWEPHAAAPIGAVLTLPATGTEMNGNSVISWRAKRLKCGFNHPSVIPMWSVLDPESTFSLPKKQVANGLADAFVHVCEQYIAHYDVGLVQDEQCEAILRALVTVAPAALCDSPPSYKARADFFWATTQALNGLIGLGVPQCWATHMIGHELTAQYGLDHGVTLAIVMPSLMRFFIRHGARKEKFARMSARVFGVSGGDVNTMAEEAVRQCEKFFQSLGIPTTFTGHGCDNSHFAEVAAKFSTMKLGPEGLIGSQEVKEILDAAL